MSRLAVAKWILLLTALMPEVAVAAPKAKVRVALVFDLSGRREPAIDVVKGVEFAAAELKAKGVVVEVVKFNSESDALGTRKAMLEALKDPADIILAEVDSSKAMVAAEMAQESGRVMLTPFATSPVVTEGRSFVFRSCFSDAFQGEQLAKFARMSLKASSAAIYADGGQLYSKTLAESFRKSFTEAGGTILTDDKILSSATSFREQVEAVAAKRPDIVFLPVYEQTAARFINEAVLRGVVASTFLGGDGWGASRTFQEIVFRKDAAAKAFWVSHYSGDFSDSDLATAAKKYTNATGEAFNASSAVGYDALMIAVEAVVAAGHERSQKAIADALRGMPAYQGLSGTIRYGGSQDPKKSLFVRRIDNGKMGFVTEMKP